MIAEIRERDHGLADLTRRLLTGMAMDRLKWKPETSLTVQSCIVIASG